MDINQAKMFVQSRACCTRPPVTLAGGYDYEVKGSYVQYNGLKTYETGSPAAKRGIFLCYDVFGLYIQALRGADILASGYSQTPDDAGEFKVFMPDFWGDHPQDMANFPPKLSKQFKAIMDFMTGPAAPDKTLPLMAPLLEEMKRRNPGIESWAIMGFCWGGKMTALMSRDGTPYKAAAQCHPSLLDVEDAKQVTIPMVVLPSMDEDPALTAKWVENLKKASPSSYSETFTDEVHGWMTSRADFNNLHVFEEYLRGYRIVRSFFAQHL